jgi:pimeloyl-ACP methyl ester carboxylesterase
MFAFLFLETVSPKKPVFLIPGFIASPLNGSTTSSPYWYCSGSRTVLFWLDDTLGIPPEFNCLADWIRLVWDPDSQDVTETSYSRLGTYPLGSVHGVTSVDSLFGIHLLPTYADLAARFLAVGYQKEVDLFGVPFDWRFGLHMNSSFWTQVTRLIEDAVVANGAKAVLIGHSMGGKFIHHFLTNITTIKWRSKFIESAVLIAPSLGGSGAQYVALWTKEFAGMGYLGTFPDTVNGMGGIHIHMFNAVIFADATVFVDEQGKVFKG